MSRFTSQLETALARTRITRVQLAELTGIPYRTLTNYALAVRPADTDAMAAICRALPEDEAAALLVARLADECPAEFHRLVRIEPRDGTLHDVCAPYHLPEMPEQTRRAIDTLAHAAALIREWSDLVEDLARVVAPPGLTATAKPEAQPPHPLEAGLRAKAAARSPAPPSVR